VITPHFWGASAVAGVAALVSPQMVVVINESASTRTDLPDAFGLMIAPTRSAPISINDSQTFQSNRPDLDGGTTPPASQFVQELRWYSVVVTTKIEPPQMLFQGWVAKPSSNAATAQPLPELAKSESSPLADLIQAERSVAVIDKENAAVADAATNDAVEIVRRNKIGGSPLVMFSDDGVLALQWQRGEHGVAMVFAGDGLVSIGFRRPGQLYAQNGIEIRIMDSLPTTFTDALTVILT
jgi:hypothetical protein